MKNALVALGDEDIEREVTRYSSLPGQALSYKVTPSSLGPRLILHTHFFNDMYIHRQIKA